MASRVVKEYLVTLDDAAFGAASDVTPKFVSPSDPAAQTCEVAQRSPFSAQTGGPSKTLRVERAHAIFGEAGTPLRRRACSFTHADVARTYDLDVTTEVPNDHQHWKGSYDDRGNPTELRAIQWLSGIQGGMAAYACGSFSNPYSAESIAGESWDRGLQAAII